MKTKKFDSLHTLLLCSFILATLGLICDYIDEHPKEKKPACCVEVTLGESDEEKQQEFKHIRLYNLHNKSYISKTEFDCLAKNVYWEAKFEPLIGQIGVANVTHNRLKSGKWGKTFCNVVYASKQFSWTNIPKMRYGIPKGKQWERAKHSAKLFLNGTRVSNLEKVQHYHATYVNPKWADSMTKKAIIGHHIFYVKNGDY